MIRVRPRLLTFGEYQLRQFRDGESLRSAVFPELVLTAGEILNLGA